MRKNLHSVSLHRTGAVYRWVIYVYVFIIYVCVYIWISENMYEAKIHPL